MPEWNSAYRTTGRECDAGHPGRALGCRRGGADRPPLKRDFRIRPAGHHRFRGGQLFVSMGIRSIVMSAKATRLKGGALVLLSPAPNVEAVLTAAGIDMLIPIHHDLGIVGRKSEAPSAIFRGEPSWRNALCFSALHGPPRENHPMEIEAAVFRKVKEPLTIEAVDIDKPWGREVLVRTVATGVCHSDLHVVDGQGRFPLDRPIVLGPRGRRHRRGGRRRCDDGAGGRPCRRLPLGLLRQLPAMPRRTPESVHRRHRRPARQRGAAPVAKRRASRCASSSRFRAMPKRCCCTRIRW